MNDRDFAQAEAAYLEEPDDEAAARWRKKLEKDEAKEQDAELRRQQ